MKKFILSMWDDIKNGKKLDAYGTIFTLIIVVALSFIDVLSQKQALVLGISAIIMILFSLLLIRKKADETIEIIQKKRSLFSKPPQSYDHYNEHIKTAKEMFFWGGTLERITAHLFELHNQAGRSFKAKFLILKQGGIAAEMACISALDDDINVRDVDQSLQRTRISSRL